MKIKVVGIGGIGCQLLLTLARYLNYAQNPSKVEVTLIDGDFYEENNLPRQAFKQFGNKAEVKVSELKKEFSLIFLRAKPCFVTSNNVVELIREGDIVFLCVDNHQSRKDVSNRVEELQNCLLIAGGNHYTDGIVQIYYRRDGQDVTLPLDNDFHPEIQNPRDQNPGEMGCDELTPSEPQLLLTNNAIAAGMLNAFYAWLQGKQLYDEVYIDIITGCNRPVFRRKP